jgi:formamidopyrimidine-DNA glycosylase
MAMPELPEVETVRRSLEPGLYEGEVVRVEASRLKLRRRAIERGPMQRALMGARFVAARRHGKYLMLDTSSGHTLLVHLGMAGQLLLGAATEAPRKHTHVDVTLSSGRALRYVDPRRFGIVRLFRTDEVARSAELAELGPDPLAGGFDEAAFGAALAATKRDVKAVLLDQRVVAGLGNIYVSEALFEARVSPRRRAHKIKPAERAALFAAIGAVLRRSVANRGTSFSDYVDARGESGSNQHALFVYGRAGEPCRICDAKIHRIVQGGRSTFYCRRCQR